MNVVPVLAFRLNDRKQRALGHANCVEYTTHCIYAVAAFLTEWTWRVSACRRLGAIDALTSTKTCKICLRYSLQRCGLFRDLFQG